MVEQHSRNDKHAQTNLIMVDHDTLKCGLSNYIIPEMTISDDEKWDNEDEDEETLFVSYLLMVKNNVDNVDEVLWSYGIVWSQHEAKTAQKGFMNGVYILSKKVAGG